MKISKNTRKDHNNHQFFLKAVLENNLETARDLLDSGAPVNLRQKLDNRIAQYPISYEQFKHLDYEIKEYSYLATKVPVSLTWTVSALHLAAGNENGQDMVKLLLDNGADVNLVMDGDVTPLVVAVLYQNYSIVELLLKHGANVNAKTSWGKTTLHYAVQINDLRLVAVLLVHGAHVNAPLKDGRTALHMAASHGHRNIAVLLMRWGADPNLRTRTGATALHKAVANLDRPLIDAMIKEGAKIEVLLRHGRIDWSPFERLNDYEKREILYLLRNYLSKNSFIYCYYAVKSKLAIMKTDFLQIGTSLFNLVI